MKQITLTLFFAVFTLKCLAQESNIKLNIGLSNTTSFGIFRNSNIYSGTSINCGAIIHGRHGSIALYSMYQYRGNLRYGSVFALQSHLVGGGLQYHILNKEKRFSPFIEISALTEVGTNYRDGILSLDGLFPYDRIEFYEAYPYAASYYFSAFYKNTPFIGNFLIGCDVQLTSALSVNIGVGYGIRFINYKYGIWEDDANPSVTLINSLDSYTKYYDMIDVKLGISYAFSLKKKSN